MGRRCHTRVAKAVLHPQDEAPIQVQCEASIKFSYCLVPKHMQMKYGKLSCVPVHSRSVRPCQHLDIPSAIRGSHFASQKCHI